MWNLLDSTLVKCVNKICEPFNVQGYDTTVCAMAVCPSVSLFVYP